MPRLRLFVALPTLAVPPVFLIRRQPVHSVLDQQAMHGGAVDRELVKAL
jgi:hypothetical protein